MRVSRMTLLALPAAFAMLAGCTTELKHRNALLTKENEDLRAQLGDRNAALADAQQELRDRNVELAQLRQLLEMGEQIVLFGGNLPEPGQTFGDLADFAFGQAIHLGCFADGHPGPEGDMIADHRGMTVILLQNRIEHIIALIPGEINIDVRRVFAARIQKALEI